MIITVNSDLTALIETDDGGLQCRLPNYNPETLVPFASVDEVEAFARSIEGRGNYFIPKAGPAPAPRVSPVEFKLLFTAPERVAIKTARSSDPVLDDFFDIIEDPRLTHVDLGLQSTRDAIGYLAEQGLIGAERVEQILAGVMQ